MTPLEQRQALSKAVASQITCKHDEVDGEGDRIRIRFNYMVRGEPEPAIKIVLEPHYAKRGEGFAQEGHCLTVASVNGSPVTGAVMAYLAAFTRAQALMASLVANGMIKDAPAFQP